ncbi:MAG: glutamine--tRNA ligase/YqeY domain fusion protein [Phycisphaerales bacterium]|nr:glutamine--tRNA ligase/YqeY domain fusion protein [Phycisphaerales bacterium]
MSSEAVTSSSEPADSPSRPKHFIEEAIEADIAAGRFGQPGDASVVRTRFPPEPNGYLHIGHAKSICLNFSLAQAYGGSCNLRFDDTNPAKEEQEYVDSIVQDVRWLGFRWPGASESDPLAGVVFASDYFERMYELAVNLIRKGLAYVDEQSADEIRATRGTLKEPGTPSPFRDRPVEENIELFEKMKLGEFPDGSRVLRAKIDMASPNFNLRDPVMYRVVNTPHHRTGSTWHIYPMYDWAHGLEDAFEEVTHSICTLEFEDHRPLYDWFIEAINRDNPGPIPHPRQIEFARWGPSYTVTSKRRLRELVEKGHVEGWDDPRMPTISGMRRRGVTARSIQNFCDEGGVTKFNALIDVGRLENALRDDLNQRAPRRMCVLDPIKVTIRNWGDHGEADRAEWLDAINNPESADAGVRRVPFTGTLYVERDDFMEDAPKKFFRLAPGREVRLRYGYWIKCIDVIKDGDEVIELVCEYDPQTRGGNAPPPDAEGKVRKVKGTLHWVSAEHAVRARVNLFDRLFTVEQPDRKPKNAVEDWSFLSNLNPDSLRVIEEAMLEPHWPTTEQERSAGTGAFEDGLERFQFERLGYFCLEPGQTDGRPVFHRAVTLKDSWAKAAARK